MSCASRALAVAWIAAIGLLTVACGGATPSATTSSSTTAPTVAPSAAPSATVPPAAFPDVCQAMSLADRGEWTQSALHWDSASVAASAAGDVAAAVALGAVFGQDAQKVALDQASDPAATSADIATYHADVAAHASLLGGC